MRSLVVLAALVPFAVVAQAPTPAPARTIEFDHATGNARLIVARDDGGFDTTRLGRKPRLQLPRGTVVAVRVVNTNTAFYQFSKDVASSTIAEVGTVRSFFDRASPYLPTMQASLLGTVRNLGSRGTSSERAEARAAAVEAMRASNTATAQSLLAVDDAVYGKSGLQAYSAGALLAIEQMRAGTAPEVASAPLRARLNIAGSCTVREPVHTSTATALLTALSGVVESAAQLRASLTIGDFSDDPTWRALADSAAAVQERARLALTDFEPLVTAAYHTEHLVGLVVNACPTWNAGQYTVAGTEAQQLSIQIAPRAEEEIARAAERGSTTYQLTLEPRLIAKPALAFAGLVSPSARYSTYATRPVAGGAEVYANGRKDQRFALGASLGFAPAVFDHRDGGSFALWLPELVLGTTGNTHSVGVGSALSWGSYKIGVGALWVRHKDLHGAAVGDVLKAGTTAPVEDVYGKPQLYVSLASFGFSGFGQGKGAAAPATASEGKAAGGKGKK